MIRRCLTLVTSFIILMGCFLFNPIIRAEQTNLRVTIYVNANNTVGPWDGTLQHPYQHIQDGINNATIGDTVFVFSGYYYEKVSITKNINLIGQDQNTTTISYWGSSYKDNIVYINGENIQISHFSIILNNGTSNALFLSHANNCNIFSLFIHSSWGLLLDKSSNNCISNSIISTINGGINIATNQSQYNLVKGNYFTNIGNHSQSYNYGVFILFGATNNIISENTFKDCQHDSIITQNVVKNVIEKNIIIGNKSKSQNGICLTYLQDNIPNGNIVRQNIITNCTECGIVSGIDGNTIIGNHIDHCGYGMSISTNFITEKNNTIRYCNVGQDIRFASFPTIFQGNIYDHCTEGIETWNCNLIHFDRNIFSNDTYGIISHVSNFNLFFHNNFMNNKNDVFQQISRNLWLHNYWSQPRLLPKPIFGILPFVQFDWLPAQHPN